ncbi:MAG: sugar ABC transporter permease [Clostridiales bacterium]|jgi:ABC-type sugar transport system permease subunit|nr:sugar ABC transporter permease [Clostridiales bacterium]
MRVKTDKRGGEGASLLSRLAKKIRIAVYSFECLLFRRRGPKKFSTKGLSKRKRNDVIFYALMAMIPIIQFCIFYIVVNINYILLSFREYSIADGRFIFAGFRNFVAVINDFSGNGLMLTGLLNSLVAYAVGLGVSLPLGLLFSFYVYKKMLFANNFRLILFLPSIVPGLVMTMMYGYFVDRALPSLLQLITHKETIGLLSDPAKQFGSILFYCIWAGFGGGVLIYTGAMSGIDDSVVESARLDGASMLQEFFRITIPLIWPTLSIFLATGIIGIFTNQLALFNFFGADAPSHLTTLGYYMYAAVQRSVAAGGSELQYPYLSALGLCMTAIILPLTLTARRLLEKLGPKTY